MYTMGTVPRLQELAVGGCGKKISVKRALIRKAATEARVFLVWGVKTWGGGQPASYVGQACLNLYVSEDDLELLIHLLSAEI